MKKSLVERLQNLSSVTIKNVPIVDIDASVGKCKSLRNIELVNTNLVKLGADLFPSDSMLTQLIVDNNPLVELPSTLFCLESLRCIVLTRVSLEQLPDDWFSEQSPEIRVRMIHIAQTKLLHLPKDLILYNSSSLEQLTFQGYKTNTLIIET